MRALSEHSKKTVVKDARTAIFFMSENCGVVFSSCFCTEIAICCVWSMHNAWVGIIDDIKATMNNADTRDLVLLTDCMLRGSFRFEILLLIRAIDMRLYLLYKYQPNL